LSTFEVISCWILFKIEKYILQQKCPVFKFYAEKIKMASRFFMKFI